MGGGDGWRGGGVAELVLGTSHQPSQISDINARRP
jgi:hypothetical protein